MKLKKVLAAILTGVMVVGSSPMLGRNTVVKAAATETEVNETKTASAWFGGDANKSTAYTLAKGNAIRFQVSVDALSTANTAAVILEATDGTNYLDASARGNMWGALQEGTGSSGGTTEDQTDTLYVKKDHVLNITLAYVNGNELRCELYDETDSKLLFPSFKAVPKAEATADLSVYLYYQLGTFTLKKVTTGTLDEVGFLSTVDSTALFAAIDLAKTKMSADYTEETYNALKTSLEAAEAVKDSDNQAGIDTATSNLQNALQGLQENKTENICSGLVGCYSFSNNIKDMISQKEATPVVITDGTVTNSASASLAYQDNGIKLGTNGLKLVGALNGEKTNAYTISMRVKFDSSSLSALDKAIYCIGKAGAWSVDREVLYTGWNDKNPAILSEIGSAATTWNWAGKSSAELATDQAYNIIVRKESNRTNMYIDGSLVASATNAKTTTATTAYDVLIGANSWGLTGMTVYDCKIYDRTLSAGEITALNKISADDLYVEYVKAGGAEDIYNIASYRGDTYTSPVKEGKIFAGWYEDAEYTKPIGADVKTGTAYAKFADPQLLTAKYQLTAGTTADSSETAVRLLLGVDSLKYSKVGFKVKYGEGSVHDLSSATVYENIGITEGDQTMTVSVTDYFGSTAKYILPYKITGVQKADFGKSFQVTPYWVTMDGTTVEGEQRTFTVTEGLSA